MNKNYIISGVLGIAVIILFILHFTGTKCSSNSVTYAEGDSTTMVKFPIAYINSDSLLMNYIYAKELNETLLQKAESSRATLNQRGNKLQADMIEFDRKLKNNAFLTEQRAQDEYASLMKRQQELQEQSERIQQELALEQMKMNQQMVDTVMVALKVFNKGPQYKVIFNNAGGNSTILLADEAYDITAEVTVFLNGRYIPAKKK